MRNGRRMSHTNGYRIRASSATGQHSTNRMHQSKKAAMMVLLTVVTTWGSPKFQRGESIRRASRQAHVVDTAKATCHVPDALRPSKTRALAKSWLATAS